MQKKLRRKFDGGYPKKSPGSIRCVFQLDGFYITKSELQSLEMVDFNNHRFNDGWFMGLQRFEKNSIDAFQLTKYGVTIKGVPLNI